jgi:membrane protease YdiL (CAAX protease family)
VTEVALDPWVLSGPLSGAALFVVLTCGRLPHGRPPLRSGVPLRWARLGLGAGLEEVVWRGVVLAGLAAWFGSVVALALSSAGFAAWHWPSLGRRSAWHLVTGGAFGGACLLGGLTAAVLAHAVYNVLVDWAVLADRAGRRKL